MLPSDIIWVNHWRSQQFAPASKLMPTHASPNVDLIIPLLGTYCARVSHRCSFNRELEIVLTYQPDSKHPYDKEAVTQDLIDRVPRFTESGKTFDEPQQHINIEENIPPTFPVAIVQNYTFINADTQCYSILHKTLASECSPVLWIILSFCHQ